MDEKDEPVTLPAYMPDTNPTYTAKWHLHKPADPVPENMVKATCEDAGSYDAVTYCSECGEELDRESKVLPATDHDWGEWIETKPATELEEGSQTRTCKNDSSHTETRVLPVLGHKHSLTKVKAKAATCEKDGSIEYWICDKGENPCGRYFADSKGRKEINKEDTIVKATGHKWGKWKVTKKPTATAAGERQRVCKNEPAHVEKQKIPATGGSGTLLPEMTAKGKRDLAFSWTKVDGAAGYDIFLAKCNKGNKVFHCKIIKTIKGNKTFSWTEKGLKKRTSYKAYVKAYVMKDGRKIYVKTSPVMHAYTSGGTKKYTNAKEVTVKKAAVSIKAGKKYKIRASVKKLKKKKKLIPKGHAPKLRYMSSNAKIAVVNSSGKITAKTKGTCTIYVYAHNGVYKTVRVTVK